LKRVVIAAAAARRRLTWAAPGMGVVEAGEGVEKETYEPGME